MTLVLNKPGEGPIHGIAFGRSVGTPNIEFHSQIGNAKFRIEPTQVPFSEVPGRVADYVIERDPLLNLLFGGKD